MTAETPNSATNPRLNNARIEMIDPWAATRVARCIIRIEFLQGLQLEYGEVPVWLEEADDVFSAQGVNVRRRVSLRAHEPSKHQVRKFGLNLRSVPRDFCSTIQPRMWPRLGAEDFPSNRWDSVLNDRTPLGGVIHAITLARKRTDSTIPPQNGSVAALGVVLAPENMVYTPALDA
jgi:hypothetical protein